MTSKIVVNNIESDSGVSSVTFNSNIQIGSGTTIHSSGIDLGTGNLKGHNLESTGIVTATSFSGSGASLTSLPAGNLSGTLPAISATNLTNVPAANITGTLPAIDGSNLTNLPASGKATNLVINGAMMVAQRGSSSTSSGYHTVDRFNVQFGGTDEAMTVEQANVASGTTPYTLGFLKCLKVTNGNQTSGAGGGDWLEIYQYLEDQDICNSGWNFKSATSYLTISFWVKSSVSQKFAGFFYTNTAGQGDSYTYSYQIDNGSGGNLSTNTWTKITHKIPGSSSLTFNNDNTRGFAVGIFPFDGTDYTTPGHNEETWQQWSSSNKLKDMDSTWWTTNDATFELTGVQLEVGDTATDFAHERYADTILKCYRYYYAHKGMLWGATSAGDHLDLNITFPVPMRTAPSRTQVDTSLLFKNRLNQNNSTSASTYSYSGVVSPTGDFWVARPGSGDAWGVYYTTTESRGIYYHAYEGTTSYAWSAEL